METLRSGFLATLLGLTAAAISASSASGATQSPQIPMLGQGEGRTVAVKLALLLEQRYTYPAIGFAYATRLRTNAGSGRYDVLNWKQFCDIVTGDLRAVHPDLHLFVNAGIPGAPITKASEADPMPATEAGQWAAPGIAYIRLNRFTGEPANADDIHRFLIAHQRAKTLILDLREHHGGRFEEMDAIIPLLYKHPTPLLDMAIATAAERDTGQLARSPSLRQLSVKNGMTIRRHWAIPDVRNDGLQSARVLVLTSRTTGSAGEHLADALKVSRRAILIGEPTAGANHFGGEVPISDHFYAYLPMGRTYDPRTGEDWEGRGVAPDIATPPAKALEVALHLAGLATADAKTISNRIQQLLVARKR